MKIRAVQENDFFAINELMLEVNQADSGENMELRKEIFSAIVSDPLNFIFAGLVDDEIVTSCYLNIIPNITWGPAPYALIENVVTTAAHRQNGYGRKCIAYAMDFAFDKKGCFKILLSSSQRDDRTRAFYGSVGFEQSKDGYVVYRNFKEIKK